MTPDVFIAKCTPAYDCMRGQNDRPVWQSLRNIWTAMGLDPDNPFGGLLRPNGFAVIKPNWVLHENHSGHGLDCLISHSTMIYYMVDWCAQAMNGRGRIVVGDAPIQGCRFETLLEKSGVLDMAAAIRNAYPKLDLAIEDWRLTLWAPAETAASIHGECGGRQHSRTADDSIRSRYAEIDLGAESFLEEVADYADRFRVTMYRPSLLQRHHRRGTHQYLVRTDPLHADLFINLAKMKTHVKAGLTGALKNLVGVNGHKEYLPHHIKGAYFSGGDAYCRENRFAAIADNVYDALWEERHTLGKWQLWWREHFFMAMRAAARFTGGDRIQPGSWSGNETIWRTTLDLNHLLYFGERHPAHVLNVVDGVVAGEGDGPLSPSPVPLGMIVVGENPACVDAVLAKTMGYNLSRIPTVYHAIHHRKSRFGGTDLQDIPVLFAAEKATAGKFSDVPIVGFLPPRNWERAMVGRVDPKRRDRGRLQCCSAKGESVDA